VLFGELNIKRATRKRGKGHNMQKEAKLKAKRVFRGKKFGIGRGGKKSFSGGGGDIVFGLEVI
jgi:hypothetical protein